MLIRKKIIAVLSWILQFHKNIRQQSDANPDGTVWIWSGLTQRSKRYRLNRLPSGQKVQLNFLGLFFFFSVGAGTSFAQDSSGHIKPVQSIELIADGYITSNTITNNFIRSLYAGDFIDNALKEGVSGKISSANRLGASSKLGIRYTFQSMEGENQPVFSFSFFDRTNIDLKFSEDLFNTVFYGNKMYAGTTASLGNFKLNFLRYQQLRFGWDWKGDFFHGSYGVAFSLLSGEQNTNVNALFADMYTAVDGTFIDLYLKMKMQQTDTAKASFFAQNGMGLSTDLYYELPYIAWKNPGKITFEVRDLGFIRWKNNSLHHSTDSVFHYEGVEVEDIFNLDSSSFAIDNVIDKNTSFERKRYTTNIPFTLDIHTKVNYGRHIAFEKGIVCLFNTTARPYYYAKFHFLFGKNRSVDLALLAGYGGYGGFNSGLDLKMDFAKHYSLHYVNNYLISGLVTDPSYGMGTYLKLARKF